uniref:Venom CUB domain protein 5 n=1 Tax=Oncocephalus sp. TaxID=2944721 RepID=A0AB38ZER1_9HEMI
MSKWYLIVLLVGVASSSNTEHRITKLITVPKDGTIELLSLDYPNIPAVGTAQTWYLTSEEGTRIQLKCEDIWIAPSKRCLSGWFKINTGRKDERFCGNNSGLVTRSIRNEMMVQIDLNNTTGRSKCTVETINE